MVIIISISFTQIKRREFLRVFFKLFFNFNFCLHKETFISFSHFFNVHFFITSSYQSIISYFFVFFYNSFSHLQRKRNYFFTSYSKTLSLCSSLFLKVTHHDNLYYGECRRKSKVTLISIYYNVNWLVIFN